MNVPAIELILSEIKTPQALKALVNLAGLPVSEIHDDIKNKYISIVMEFLSDIELFSFLNKEPLDKYLEDFSLINKNWEVNFPFIEDTKFVLFLKFVDLITENHEKSENKYESEYGFANTTIFKTLFDKNTSKLEFSEIEEKILFEKLKKSINTPLVNILYDSLGHDAFLNKLEKYQSYELLKSTELINKIVNKCSEEEIWNLFNKNKDILDLYGSNISLINKISDNNKINEIKTHNTLLEIKRLDLLKSELKDRLRNIPNWKSYKTSEGDTTYHFIAAKNLSHLNSEANTNPELLIKRLNEKNNMGKTPIDVFLNNLTSNSELTTQLTEKMKEVLKRCEYSRIDLSLDNIKMGVINLTNIINIFSNINLSFEDTKKFRKNYKYNAELNNLSNIDYSKLSDRASDSAIAFLIALKVNAHVLDKFNLYSAISLSKGNIDLVNTLIPSIDFERKNNIHILLLKHYEEMSKKTNYLNGEEQKEIFYNLKAISNVILETKIIKNILINDENIENKRKRI